MRIAIRVIELNPSGLSLSFGDFQIVEEMRLLVSCQERHIGRQRIVREIASAHSASRHSAAKKAMCERAQIPKIRLECE